MVQPPNCSDCLEIGVNSFDTVTRIVNADVTLRNQFGIPGHDVRGILFTNETGHMHTNADEWTHLYDPVGGMDHNPFKAFAETEPNRGHRFDSADEFYWASVWGNESSDGCDGIATNSSGEVWMTGAFYDTVDFNPDPVEIEEHTSIGESDIYLMKLMPTGLW